MSELKVNTPVWIANTHAARVWLEEWGELMDVQLDDSGVVTRYWFPAGEDVVYRVFIDRTNKEVCFPREVLRVGAQKWKRA